MQDTLENVFAQRETLIDPWRKQWLSVENYGLVRAAEDMMYDLQIGAIFYSRLLKKNFAVEIIPKKNKVEKISENLWADTLQTVYRRWGNEGLIAILAQPPFSSPTIASPHG